MVNLAAKWFAQWHLKINGIEYIAVLHSYSKHNNKILFNLNDDHIDWSTNARHLRVSTDRSLNFNMHMTNLIENAGKTKGSVYPVLKI